MSQVGGSYRGALAEMGVTILADNATRTPDHDSEVHLLLLRKGNEIGFLMVHDNYDPTYAPMFGEGYGYKMVLDGHTHWWDTPQELYDYFRTVGDGFWKAHRVGRDHAFLVNGFLSDVGNLLRERYQVT